MKFTFFDKNQTLRSYGQFCTLTCFWANIVLENLLAKQPFFTVFLYFLERERDRLRLFVPKRYCVPTRSFLGDSDR
jgi:hypothetical protein